MFSSILRHHHHHHHGSFYLKSYFTYFSYFLLSTFHPRENSRRVLAAGSDRIAVLTDLYTCINLQVGGEERTYPWNRQILKRHPSSLGYCFSFFFFFSPSLRHSFCAAVFDRVCTVQ